MATTVDWSGEGSDAVRIAELSRSAGVPVPTIKYYLREGLVPPGERTSPNQAQYDEGHVRRLKLVRALIDVGGLSVAAARSVLGKMDSPGLDVLHSLGKAQYAITAPRERVEDEAWELATEQVDKLVEQRDWQIRADNPARQTLAEVMATLRRLGHEDYLAVLDDYATAAEQLANAEIDMILHRTDVDSMAEAVIIWTLLGDALLAALRRLTQEHAAATKLSGGAKTVTAPKTGKAKVAATKAKTAKSA
jgi:DNA-binding transcriptional MerR regulator